MSPTARGTCSVEMRAGVAELGGAELGGAVGRFDLSKTIDGDLRGNSSGVVLSAENPQAGSAGYVALKIFTGQVEERSGTFALQQFGTMDEGVQVLHYDVISGSGSGKLTGITSSMRLVDKDGGHRYELDYGPHQDLGDA